MSSIYIKLDNISLHDHSNFAVLKQTIGSKKTKEFLKAVKDNSHFLVSPFSFKWACISNFTH